MKYFSDFVDRDIEERTIHQKRDEITFEEQDFHFGGGKKKRISKLDKRGNVQERSPST